jgi:hypothetical protein
MRRASLTKENAANRQRLETPSGEQAEIQPNA